MSDQMTLGGRPLTPDDWFQLGILVAAVDSCRSIYLDSDDSRIELRGVRAFSRAILAVEHFRKRASLPGWSC
jgi:hypothetical protein